MGLEEIFGLNALAQQQAQQGGLWGLGVQQAQQQAQQGGLFGGFGVQQAPGGLGVGVQQAQPPRKKVVSRVLSPQEAVTAAAKAVKDAQKLLT